MLDSDDARIYEALWRDVQAASVYIVYRSSRLNQDAAELGWFSPDPWRNGSGPQLWIMREHCPSDQREPDTAAATRRELFTLAHEMGHMRSWEGGQRTAEYESAVDAVDWPALPHESRMFILDEEDRAWRLGQGELARYGFFNWSEFDIAKAEALAEYRRRLDLPQ